MNYPLATAQLRPSAPLRLLLVDSDASARVTLRRALEARIARPMDIRDVDSFADGAACLTQNAFDAIVVDLGSVGGTEPFGRLVKMAGEAIVYAAGPLDVVGDAVAAVRNGAADFLEKPLDGAGFARRIERHFVTSSTPAPADFEGFIGVSPQIRAIFEQTLRLAASDAPVLITGESGTGKNILAKAIHRRSRRRTAPFVRLSCDGITIADLTAALSTSNPGSLLIRAQNGTLFFDDVDALDIHCQAALFRFLEGSESNTGDHRFNDVRILSAANSTAEDLVARGKLRADLLFRLAVLPLHVPALRERTEDILALAEHFLARMGRARATRLKSFDLAARKRMLTHPWPGNARELEVVIQRLAMLHTEAEHVSAEMIEGALTVASLSEPTTSDRNEVVPFNAQMAEARIRPLWVEERRIIEGAITAFGGNIARAAHALEISPSTIYRKRQTWAELAQNLTPEQLSRFG